MPATAPPASLGGLPRHDVSTGDAVHRVVRARDDEGRPREPLFFSSATAGALGPRRFDLPAPAGSCYLSDRRAGAWLEVFRGTGLVDRVDVERRRMVTAERTGGPSALADLHAPGARALGAALDLVAGDDYALPQRWARAVRAAGFPGLVAPVRHDPTARALAVVLFGAAGPRQRLRGWRSRVTPLVEDTDLLAELRPYGTGVQDRPYDVPVVAPRG
ncbi:RES family NAD+ phosphorylase [uncultured Pseudokineococcus sp.]|uniref:RES family NAD+ phosphorylase n=1 Tax=uncultured Pseudokineococcus sp. TaxID=1642928 RepID=UPI00261621B7|nr:RES family NAD+ phosphorylase [uncultured Pseudokineococcus sp.]